MKLPTFDVPRSPSRKIPAGFYEEWVLSNILRLDGAGLLERARSGRDRRPADARFRLAKRPGA